MPSSTAPPYPLSPRPSTTTTPTTTYHLRPLTPTDIPTAATVFNASFTTSEFHAAFLPHRHRFPASYRTFTLRLLRRRFADPHARYVCAVARNQLTGAEDLVGLCCAQASGGTLAARWRGERTETWASKLEGWLRWAEDAYARRVLGDAAADWSAIEGFWAAAGELYAGVPEHVHVPTIAVAPGHAGRGVGGMLLRWALGLAREVGVPVTLESSVRGLGMYVRYGFKEVGGVDMGGRRVPVMVWEPEEERGRWVVGDREGTWRIRDGVGSGDEGVGVHGEMVRAG